MVLTILASNLGPREVCPVQPKRVLIAYTYTMHVDEVFIQI